MAGLGGGKSGGEPEVRYRGDTAIMDYVVRAAMQAPDPRGTAAVILAGAFPSDGGFVAGCVGCSEDDLPGLLVAARRRLRRDRVATITEPVEALRRLRSTWTEGDRGAVAELLSPDVALYAVGRLHSGCLRLPVHGSREVAQLLSDIMGSEPPAPELRLVDRSAWLVLQRDELMVALPAIEVHRGSVRGVWLVDRPGTRRCR